MPDEKPTEAAPEPKLVRVRLKKHVIETPVRKTVTVNGQEFKLRSDADVEVPEFVLAHLGTEYELLDEKGEVLPPKAPEVPAEPAESEGTPRRRR